MRQETHHHGTVLRQDTHYHETVLKQETHWDNVCVCLCVCMCVCVGVLCINTFLNSNNLILSTVYIGGQGILQQHVDRLTDTPTVVTCVPPIHTVIHKRYTRE